MAEIERDIIQISMEDAISILEDCPVKEFIVPQVTIVQVMNRVSIAHLSIERALKFLITEAGGTFKEIHDLDKLYHRLGQNDPVSAGALDSAFQAAVRHYRFNPNATNMKHFKAIERYLETTGSDQAFQGVRYWELNQSLEEILLRKIFLNIHLELLHGLSEILISHRRPMETVDDRVEWAIKNALLKFGDRWYEPETIREYPVGSYNHWLTKHSNFKDALSEAVKEGFEIGDAHACKSMRTAYEQLLESKDPAVRYFVNSLNVLPTQPRDAIPEAEWLDPKERRKGMVRTPGGAALGVVQKYEDGLWYVTRFEGGPPKPPAKAMTQTDALCYLAVTMTRPAQVTADGEERNLRIVEGFHSDFRHARVKVDPRDPAMNKVTFWDNNHDVEVGQQVLIESRRTDTEFFRDKIEGEVVAVMGSEVSILGWHVVVISDENVSTQHHAHSHSSESVEQ